MENTSPNPSDSAPTNNNLNVQDQLPKLYRSKQNRIIAGVCGGLSERFNLDVNLIRILFFISGVGATAYILFWLFVPDNPNQNWPNKKSNLSKWVSWILIIFAILFAYGFIKIFLFLG